MKVSKTILRNLFGPKSRPTSENFGDQFDSFWHKDERIDVAAIKDLPSLLDNKLDVGAQDTLIAAFNEAIKEFGSSSKGPAVSTTVPEPNGNWFYYATEITTYNNFKFNDGTSVVVSAIELDENNVFLFVIEGIVVKKFLSKKIPDIINNYSEQNITNVTQEITQNIVQQVISPGDITLEPNYFNSTTAGAVEIASGLIKRVSKASNQVLSYFETTTNGDGPISDADVTGDGFFIKEGAKYYVQVLGAVIDVRNLGMLPGQNCAAIFNKVLFRLRNIGACFYFPAALESYIFEEQVIFPYEVISNTPAQKPFTIKGDGSCWNGKTIGPNTRKGSTIALNYQGDGTYLDAKIISYGLGKLTVEDITFEDLTDDNTPFFYSTYTTWLLQKNAFIGKDFGEECEQDVSVFGGTDVSEVGDNPNGGFQGYGTIIRDNFYSGIRRGVVGQNYFNGVKIESNNVAFTCGNKFGGFIEISTLFQSCAGNNIEKNVVEMIYYKHFLVGKNFISNNIKANGLFDVADTTESYYHLINSNYNYIENGLHDDNIPMFSGDSPNQTVKTAHQGQLSRFEGIIAGALLTETADENIGESAKIKMKGAEIYLFDRYIKSAKTLQKIRLNADGSESILSQIHDFGDEYYSTIFPGVDPRLDALPGSKMKVRAGNGQELFLGDQSVPGVPSKGITLLNGVVIMQPVTGTANNCLFIDAADGKLKFQDGSGIINPLY